MDRLVKWVEFPPLGDDRGSLVALEANKTIPFDIYLFGTKQDVTRGLHAHLALKQVQWQLINQLVGVFGSKVVAGYKIVKTIIVVNFFGVVIFFREQRRKRLVRGMIDFWYSALNSFKVSSL